MKKIFILLLLIFTFFITNLRTEACPTWATNDGTFLFDINDCSYRAKLCWSCPINSQMFKITIEWFECITPGCTNGLQPNQIIDEIFSRVNTYSWLVGLCAPGTIPDCPTPLSYSLINYNCWYMYNDGSVIRYLVCNFNSWCQQDWTCCWDEDYGFVKTLVNDWHQEPPLGTIYCPTQMPPRPDPEEFSDCWQLIFCDD